MSLFICLRTWLRRPWWTRIWTVQEILLARRLVFTCGTVECSGEEIFFLARSFFRHTKDCCLYYEDQLRYLSVDAVLSSHFSHIEALSKFQARVPVSPIPMEELFDHFLYRISSDPHDYIYGFLGIASDDYTRTVDYTKSSEDTFKHATLISIWNFGELNILSQKLNDERQRLDSDINQLSELSCQLPSWCPD